MPTPDEIEKLKQGLISNAFDFIERSAGDLESEPKFSVSHFATGIELLLKARLFAEHWSLVAQFPHKTNWESFKSGDCITIQASELASTLASVTGTGLHEHKDIFSTLFKHRNKVLHFIPSEKVASIAAEQCRCWYMMRHLLTVTWANVYSNFSDRIEIIDKQLRGYETYLKVRYEAPDIQRQLRSAQKADLLITCPVCRFESGVLDDNEAPLCEMECPVCVIRLEMVNFGCGYFHVAFEGYGACECGNEHTAEELASLLDERPGSYKDPDPSQFHCGECLELRCVVASGLGYRCYNCGHVFCDSDLDACEWCNESWVGYDCSETNWSGCELCDGAAGYHLGKDD